MKRTRRYIPNVKVIKTKYLSLVTEGDIGTYTITIGSAVTASNLSYIEYSTDNGKNWTKITNVSSTEVVTTIQDIPYKHIVMLRGNGIRAANTTSDTKPENNTRIICTCNFSVMGCLTTLLYGKYADDDTLLQDTYSFAGMFVGAKVIDIDKLIFPKNVTSGCYASMFYGCSLLKHVPKLPATSLATSCYRAMFYNCTRLEKVDELPALTVSSHAYYNMFYGCTGLKYIKMLGTNISAQNSLYRWLPDSIQNLEFHRNPAATWWVAGVNGIPQQSILFDDNEDNAEEETFIDSEVNRIIINKFGNRKPVVSFDRWQDKIKIAGVEGKILKRQVQHVVQIYNEFTSNAVIVDFSDLNKFTSLKYIGGTSLTTYYSTGAVGFYNCTALKYITLPDTLVNMGGAYSYSRGCFMNTVIENLYIPDSVKATSDHVFDNCTSLKTVRWGNALPVKVNTTTFCNYTFYKCTNLEQITNYPTTATAFGSYHFAQCKKLDMAPINLLLSQITTLNAYVFQSCQNTNLPNAIFFLNVTNDTAYMTNGLGRRKLYFPKKTAITQNSLSGNSAELIDLGNITGSYFYPGAGNSSDNKVTVVLRSTAVPTFSTFNITNVQRIYVYQDILSDFTTSYSTASSLTYPIGGTEWVTDYGADDEYADWTPYSYVKNTAATRLDTGICADDNTKIEVKLWSNVTGSFYSFGTRESSSGSHLFSLTGSYSNQSVMCGIGKTNTTATNFVRSASGYTYTTTMQTNGDMTYSFTITDGTDTFTANNVTYSESLEGNDKHIYLFSNGFNNIAATIRFYYVKIWQNGTLVMHLKPCDINGTPCMLDMVTMKQFTADNIEFE